MTVGDTAVKVDRDGGAVWFGPIDPEALTAKLCSVLDASAGEPETLVWVRRIDVASPEGTFPLFHDEDGSSHLELHHLDEAVRQRIIAMLSAAF